jgi:hypothetical protein
VATIESEEQNQKKSRNKKSGEQKPKQNTYIINL